jgi:hypothetical protein
MGVLQTLLVEKLINPPRTLVLSLKTRRIAEEVAAAVLLLNEN